MFMQILYKYRSLNNWKFALDILLNSRLYAAPFETLNDPMEGRYVYFGDKVTRQFKNAIQKRRAGWKICSLSKTASSTVMWSLYADGHRGITLGVGVPPARASGFVLKDIKYDRQVHVGPRNERTADDVAVEILAQKQWDWKHEKEVRVFVKQPFVDVEIRELVFGCRVDPEDKKLLSQLARKVLPGVKIVSRSQSDLDAPDALPRYPRHGTSRTS
jgi:hypothetical protein